jgi:tubulin---tyrosine ligase
MTEPAWTNVPIKTSATGFSKDLRRPNWKSAVSVDADPNTCSFTMSDLTEANDVQDKENAEGKMSESFEPDRVCVVLNGNGKLGSVYSEVARALARRGGWKRKKKSTGRFHMVFGEAGGAGIPFKRFSQVFRYDYGIKPLVNYNRNCKTLTDKVMLAQIMQKYQRENLGEDTGMLIPETYLFWPGREEVSQTSLFKKAFEKRSGANVWIVKPSNEAHGNGIFLSSSINEILDHISNQPDGSRPWLVQRYVEDPLLLDGGRKFDVRVWVLLTHDFKVFIHKDGVVRTSCVRFTMQDLRDKFVHMTNHSIQGDHADFGKFEDGNEIFFPAFESTLIDNSGISFHKTILPQIKNHVKETFIAAKPILESIDEIDDYSSFMLFGFDFIINSSAKVLLLEVNATPAIAKNLLPKISTDIIKTAIDPVFPRLQVDSKEADSDFELLYESKGKCEFICNMPGPDASEDVEIESFGLDCGESQACSKK